PSRASRMAASSSRPREPGGLVRLSRRSAHALAARMASSPGALTQPRAPPNADRGSGGSMPLNLVAWPPAPSAGSAGFDRGIDGRVGVRVVVAHDEQHLVEDEGLPDPQHAEPA